jgi:hypothetical protein
MTPDEPTKPEEDASSRPNPRVDKMSENSLTGPKEDVGGGGVAGDSMTETRGVGGGPSIPEPVTKDIGKR